MGDMADMALDNALRDEMYADEYVSGGMSSEEAMDHGFLDATGTEAPELGWFWDRQQIPTPENLDHELEVNILRLESNWEVPTRICADEPAKVAKPRSHRFNAEDPYKITRASVPKCNICGERMTPRMGKFGKFYFCGNYCPEQKPVSDNYWQSLGSEE